VDANVAWSQIQSLKINGHAAALTSGTFHRVLGGPFYVSNIGTMVDAFSALELDSDSDDESYAPSESDDNTEVPSYIPLKWVDQTDDLHDALPNGDKEVANIVVKALDELAKLRPNVPFLLELVSWGHPACRSNPQIKSAPVEI
jgi:hypothetical protein